MYILLNTNYFFKGPIYITKQKINALFCLTSASESLVFSMCIKILYSAGSYDEVVAGLYDEVVAGLYDEVVAGLYDEVVTGLYDEVVTAMV